MWAAALKVFKYLQLAKNKNAQNLGKKIVILILSPIVALVFLIGGIFSDGINFNHNIINDLFNGVPINTSHMDREQAQYIKEMEVAIALINNKMEQENNTFEEGYSLDAYLVKGFYIGIMFTEQKIVINEETIEQWVHSFIVEDEAEKRIPTSDYEIIFKNIEEKFTIQFAHETKQMMINIVGGLKGNGVSGTVTTLSKEEIDKLIKNLPKDTSKLRKNIVIQAADAVGKIPYYWGGYALVAGYEGNDFGKPTSPDAHGRTLKGMDCSHFVDWVYWTVMNNNLGNTNTEGQIKQCSQIEKSELLPGDLAFLKENGVTTHVGIYAGRNEKGEAVWIHENAADNNVSINTVSYWNVYCRLNFMKGK